MDIELNDGNSWRDYIKEAERGSVESTLEWCRRVYEAKQHYGGSFRAWANEWYSEYGYNALFKLARVGKENPRLFIINKQTELPNDWNTLYQLTTLADDEIADLPALDQKSIRQYKMAKKNSESYDTIDLRPNGEPPWNIILADPPWSYNDKATSGGHWAGADNHYGTMSIEALQEMRIDFNGNSYRIEEIAADDALLFMWTTWPFLQDSFRVVESWGFTYKTLGAIWTKTNKDGTPYMGLGNYFRIGSEPCLLCVRGKGVQRVNAGVNSDIRCPRTAHSAKPDALYQMIEKAFGETKKIELFARSQRNGWDVYGNQVQQELSYGD